MYSSRYHAQCRCHAGRQARDRQVGQAYQRAHHVDQRSVLRHLAEDVQAVADLRRAQLAQVAVDVLDQVGDIHAFHLGQRHRHAVFVQRVVPLVVVIVVMVAVMVVAMMIVVMMVIMAVVMSVPVVIVPLGRAQPVLAGSGRRGLGGY